MNVALQIRSQFDANKVIIKGPLIVNSSVNGLCYLWRARGLDVEAGAAAEKQEDYEYISAREVDSWEKEGDWSQNGRESQDDFTKLQQTGVSKVSVCCGVCLFGCFCMSWWPCFLVTEQHRLSAHHSYPSVNTVICLSSSPSLQEGSSNKFANDGSFLQQFMKMQKEKSNNGTG